MSHLSIDALDWNIIQQFVAIFFHQLSSEHEFQSVDLMLLGNSNFGDS